MTAPKARRAAPKPLPSRVTQTAAPAIPPAPPAPAPLAPAPVSNGKKKKKRKGKGKSVATAADDALDDDEDLPPLEAVNGMYEGQPRSGSRTGLSPELESVHLSTTASLSASIAAAARLNPTTTAEAELLATADHLARSMDVDPEGGVSEEYWASFPDHLRNFVRHTYSQLSSAGDEERKTQAMYAIAQQIHAGGGVNLTASATVKGTTRTATARYTTGPPGAFPTSMPFDPSTLFTDPSSDFAYTMQQAAVKGLLPSADRGQHAQANLVMYSEEQDYPEDEYFSEDDVDELDEQMHTTEAQFTLSYGPEDPTELEAATIALSTLGQDVPQRKKNKKKKKGKGVVAYPQAQLHPPHPHLYPQPAPPPPANGQAPVPAPLPMGTPASVPSAPATNLASAPHNRMPASRPTSASNPPPSSRAAGKQPMSYAAPVQPNPPPPSRRAASKAPITSHAYQHNHAHHHPSPPSSNASAPQKHRPPANGAATTPQVKNNKIWSTSTTEERERIKEFWLGLGEEERRNLVKIEKEAVLRKMKEQQKHSCMCAVCGRKRHAIEEELEVLYDAYYEELEQYANYQQRYISSGGTIPPPQGPGPFPGSVELDKNGAVIGPQTIRSPPRPKVNGRKAVKTESEFDEDDPEEEEYEDEDEYEEEDEEDEEEDEEEDVEGEGEDEEDLKPERRAAPRRRGTANGKTARDGIVNFGNNLTVTGAGNILTVADDLLKNDGQKFLEMMEQLAERRMQREGEAVDDVADDSDEDDDEEGDEDEEDEDEEDEDEEDEVMTEEQKMEEGKRMFSIFAARMFEQRVLQAYREKVAQERQLQLLRELEDEDKLTKEKEAKKQNQNQKKKDKKRQQKLVKEEEKAQRAAEKAAEDAALKAKQTEQEEESRKRKEEERARREAQKKAQEEERQRKEEERRRRLAEEKEREAERERKRKEKEEKAKQERREREERERKAKEEKEAKLAAERAARREQQEREERERRFAKEKEEKERAEREKAEKERAEKERLEKEKAEKEAREKQLAQQQAAAKAARPPPSPRTSTASGSVPRSPNTPVPAKKASIKPQVSPTPPVIQPVRQLSQPRPTVITSPQPPHPPPPITPHLPHMLPPGTPMFSPGGTVIPPVISPRVPFSPPGPSPFAQNFGPGPSIGPLTGPPMGLLPPIAPPLAPSAVPRPFGSAAPFDAFARNLAPPAPIAPPQKPMQNPLASPTQLAPGARRSSMAADLGPIGRPVAPIAPIAPIARPAGEPSGSGSTSPNHRTPSPKGVLGSSALAADDDEIVTAPGRRSVAPGAVGWGPTTASPRSNGPDMRMPWSAGGGPGFPSPRPPLWNPSAPGSEWHPSPPFFGSPFTNHNPSPPPHTGN